MGVVYMTDPMACRFDVPYDCSVELSHSGYQFFTDIFETFDKVIVHLSFRRSFTHYAYQDQDGALKPSELSELFSTAPGNPWASQKFADMALSDDTGALTLQGWLAQWRSVVSLLRPAKSNECL